MPVEHPDPQRLDELYGYGTEKEKVLKNTEALLRGLRANNILLYGDAGTGKSSMLLTGAEIIVEVLIEQGVTDLFGYPGGAALNIYEALYTRRDRIHHYLTAHACPEAAQGGPIGLVEEGDLIDIDIPSCRINLLVDEETLARRRAAWICPEPAVKTGYLARYAKQVTSAARGAVLE